jgi:hypothetical protein
MGSARFSQNCFREGFEWRRLHEIVHQHLSKPDCANQGNKQTIFQSEHKNNAVCQDQPSIFAVLPFFADRPARLQIYNFYQVIGLVPP